MKIRKITNHIVEVNFPTQRLLTETFLRFQESYESPNPKFRNSVFTLGQFIDWYSQENGGFTYYTDWEGMNIPSYVLTPFIKGLFDPLSPLEEQFVNLFKSRTDKFYVIGTFGENHESLDHEWAHALYYTDVDYRGKVNQILKDYNLSDLKAWLIKRGYCNEVLDDECHAYIIADGDWLEEEEGIVTPTGAFARLVDLFNATRGTES